jgi:hypothetical protein
MSRWDKSWRDLVSAEMAKHGDSLANVLASVPTLDSDEMSRTFNTSYGCQEGCAFTLWTAKRVYFPVVYDGSEWAGSAPRNPCDEATEHVGGE